VTIRPATTDDITAIAALHADSWRRNYRGAYPDEYLDGDVMQDRVEVWTQRLTDPSPTAHTTVAEDSATFVGFCHTEFDADERWGALLDNLHVTTTRKRSGIGTLLMADAARATLDHRPDSGLFLWVLAQNTAAQAFYRARGGTFVEEATARAPGSGVPIPSLRVAWPEPVLLLGQ